MKRTVSLILAIVFLLALSITAYAAAASGDTIVYRLGSGKKYHTANCSTLSGKEPTEITLAEAAKLKEDGIISGGMIPKVDCCIDAINKGVKNVVIMDGRVPHSILMELLTDEGAGTMVKGGEA